VDDQFADLPVEYRTVIPKSDHVLFVEPSPGCSSGTKGRVAVMEGIAVDSEIEQLILKGGSEDEIQKVARKRGYISMHEDALMKALQHTIPFEEVSTLSGAFLVSEEAEEEARKLKQTLQEDTPVAVDNPPKP